MEVHEITIDELMDILRECAGESGAPLDGELLDVDFEQLGYDSIALLEMAAQLDARYGVEIDDEAMQSVRTPRALLEVVNRA